MTGMIRRPRGEARISMVETMEIASPRRSLSYPHDPPAQLDWPGIQLPCENRERAIDPEPPAQAHDYFNAHDAPYPRWQRAPMQQRNTDNVDHRTVSVQSKTVSAGTSKSTGKRRFRYKRLRGGISSEALLLTTWRLSASQNPGEKPHFAGYLQENAGRQNCVVVSRGLKLHAMLAYCANRSPQAGCLASGIMPDYPSWVALVRVERDLRAVSVGERSQTRSCSDDELVS
jgi:hypothetical protein